MDLRLQYDEPDLVARLGRGDEAAFVKIYAQYSQRILGALIKLVASENTACELLQEVFIRLWKNREQIDPAKPLKPYLFRIAENLTYDFFRKAARDRALRKSLTAQVCTEYNHVEEALCNKESLQLLQEIISSLPPQRQKIFQLVKIEGKTYAEVSALLNISASTVNDHVVKATKFIREQMYSDAQFLISPVILLLLL